MNTIYENKEICSQCGGMCCKKSGCDYSPDDLSPITLNSITKKLEEGNISIVSAQIFKYINGKLTNSPFLYLRARNIDRPIVDLLSMKKTCACLTENGCIYDLNNRPSGGVNLIPNDKGPCSPKEDPYSIIKGWDTYQALLRKLVKRMTGNTIYEQIKIDTYKLFCDYMDKKFEGISPIEIEDIKGLIPLLAEAYPEEYQKAKNRNILKINF